MSCVPSPSWLRLSGGVTVVGGGVQYRRLGLGLWDVVSRRLCLFGILTRSWDSCVQSWLGLRLPGHPARVPHRAKAQSRRGGAIRPGHRCSRLSCVCALTKLRLPHSWTPNAQLAGDQTPATVARCRDGRASSLQPQLCPLHSRPARLTALGQHVVDGTEARLG